MASANRRARSIPFKDPLLSMMRAPAGSAAEQPWLAAMRAAAHERYLALGLPSPRVEEWKYTNLAPLAGLAFALPTPAAASEAALDAFATLGPADHRLVFVNGRLDVSLSRLGVLPEGVLFGGLAALLEREPARLAPHLGQGARLNGQALAALNGALMQDGGVLVIPPGHVLKEPIHLVFLGAAPASPLAWHPRLLVVAGADSRATLIESHLGQTGPYWSNLLTEVMIGDRAVFEHYKLQAEGAGAFHTAYSAVGLGEQARYRNVTLSLGARLARNEIVLRFNAPGAEAALDGAYLLDGAQHCDNTLCVDHAAPRCASRQIYKGVLDGTARGVFQGKITVHPGAVKTDGHQLSRAILLSPRAEIDTKPELEIYADDVKCGHGASAGALDEAQLFYLRARGIEQGVARALLIEGFLGDVLESIADLPQWLTKHSTCTSSHGAPQMRAATPADGISEAHASRHVPAEH